MAEKKKKRDKNNGRRGNEDGSESNKLTKDEDAIARFVRFNCPTNSTVFEGNEVHYFAGKKAVDVLVESKKYGAAAKTPKFLDNAAAEAFLQTLLAKGLFFRAKKLVPKKKEKPLSEKAEKCGSGDIDVSKSPPSGAKTRTAEKKQRKEAEEGTKEENNGGEPEETKEDEEEEEQQEKRETNNKEEEKRRKKKVKLMFHEVQAFDTGCSDVYVWVFDPTPLWKKFVGILIVLGTIGGCLFPLWPDWLRLGIYYLSVLGIALFGLLFGVAFVRTILYGLIWLFTLGRHRLWLLPNLLEEVGFWESFRPVYTYEYVPGGIFAPKNKKKKGDDTKKDKKLKENDRENEEEGQQQKQKDADRRREEGERDGEEAQLLSQEKHCDEDNAGKEDNKRSHAGKEDNKRSHAMNNGENGEERNCNSRTESDSQHSSKKDGTSGSEEEDGEEAQTCTDDSNSWEKLSENSAAENGNKKTQ